MWCDMKKVDNVNDILGVVYNYRQEYSRITVSFFNRKESLNKKRKWKDYIYSLNGDNIKCTKRNAIWEYMNGYIEYEILEEIIESK